MRFSDAKPLEIKEPIQSRRSNRSFFDAVAEATKPEERRCGLLLVGGTGPSDLVIRQAQTIFRFDHLPSDWSHAALVLDWEDDPRRAIGIEATLNPRDPSAQVPERNGVTLFKLSQYLRTADYPNLVFATFRFPSSKDKNPGPREVMQQAAFEPNRERLRYPLWRLLGQWKAYVHDPEAVPNPLAAGRPLPAAAFIEYLFECAGYDFTPGSTAPNASPEQLWATLKRWHDRMGTGDGVGKIRAWRVVRQESGLSRDCLAYNLRDDFEAMRA
jgi:hypothetical protein